MTMHLFWFVVGCVLSGVVLLPVTGDKLPADGTLSSTILSGPVFYVTGWNTTHADLTNHIIVMVTNEPNGVPLNGPELRVVANTTVYFHITGIASYSDDYSYPIAFGLTLASNYTAGTPADALGLTPSPASVSAGACYSYLANDPDELRGPSRQGRVQPNTFGLNFTTHSSATTYQSYRTFSTTPCVLQWQVPAPNATNYYYIEPWNPSSPRQIHIVSSDPIIPSTGTGSGSGSGSNNNNTSTGTTTDPPTSNGTTAPTGTSSSSTGTGTGTSSSTGSKTPSSAFASAHLSGWAALPLVAALAAISTTTAAAL